MFKKIVATILMSIMLSANASTWWVGNVYVGNVCRAGAWYFVYSGVGFPVGSVCYFTLPAGQFQGFISNE